MNTVTFEVTESKTLVIATGTKGVEKFDITDTDIEKDLIKLLKKISEYRQTKQILDAIDIDKWSVLNGA